jgi:hypothetical protein
MKFKGMAIAINKPMKTLRLIESYIHNIAEQDASADPNASSNEISSNERYIIKILTNALIFNPAKFPDQREGIFSDIDRISRAGSQPIAATIRQIKDIISLDRSLVIEGEVSRLFGYYTEMLERNSLDATEPQLDSEPVDGEEPTKDPSLEIDVDLDEIFPLYQDMILSALRYEPTSRDLMMLRDVVNGIDEADTLTIVDTVQSIMNSKRSEEGVADDLTDI